MSLYALLRNNPTPSELDIERAIDGNLCRCTGYRPIIAAGKEVRCFFKKIFYSKCAKFAAKSKQKICPGSGKPCSCGNNDEGEEKSLVAAKQEDATVDFDEDGNPICALIGQRHLLFPSALKQMKLESLYIKGDRCQWFAPVSLDELLDIKAKYTSSCKFVLGNTELALDVRFKNVITETLINPLNVKELKQLLVSNDEVVVGASSNLTDIGDFFHSIIAQTKPEEEYKNRVLHAALHMFERFGSTPIRNFASVGGNIVTASPISDLNQLWIASNSYLTVMNTLKQTRVVFLKNFFLDYRRVDLKPDEIVISLHIPFSKQNEYIQAYSQAKRRDDDIAIVNACIRMQVEQDSFKITDCLMAYGGMNKITKSVTKTSNFLIGKLLNEETVTAAIQLILQELDLQADAPGGMIEYRNSLAIGFFYKFYLYLRNVLNIDKNESLKSAFTPFERPASSGEQFFEVVQSGRSVGKPENVRSALLHATGEATFVDDIEPLASELSAYPVISQEPYAKIKQIRVEAALNMPGVKGFISAKDVPGSNNWSEVEGANDDKVFHEGVVNNIGLLLGLIVATSVAEAKAAAKKVVVEYEKIEGAIFTIEEAIEKKSFYGLSRVIADGDVEAAFADPQVKIISGEMRIGGQEHFYMEPHVALAIPQENKEMLVYSSTQNLTRTQAVIAQALGIDRNRVTVKAKRVGGGFGGKEIRAILVSSAASVAAKKMNKPVRLVLERDIDMMMSGQRHPFYAKYKVAVTNQGKMTGLQVDLYNNGGYSLDLSVAVMEKAMLHIENCYKIPNICITGTACKTHIGSNTAFRAFGAPQALLIAETIIDHISKELSIPEHIIRPLNFYKSNETKPCGQVLVDADRIQRLFTECSAISKYEEKLSQVQKFNQLNKYKKQGLVLLPSLFGASFHDQFLNQSSALVHIYQDGSVLVTHGGIELGQGLHTKVAQVASTVLDIPIDMIYISETSSDKIANATATAASMGSDLYGAATKIACEQLLERMKPIKEKLGASAKWPEIVKTAYSECISLSAHAHYKTPDAIFFNRETGKGSPYHYYSYGCACTLVELDCLTGDHHVLSTDIAMDCGNSLNPFVDIGQIEGAFIQGMGLYTTEELIWGDLAHKWVKPGVLFTRGPGSYKIVSICMN